MDPGEPLRPGTPHQAQQNRLCLIVECVCCGDFVDLVLTNQVAKKPVTQLPPGGFQSQVLFTRELRRVCASRVEGQFVSCRQFSHEHGIFVRFLPANLVIEVRDRKDNAELTPYFEQQSQQRNRIRTAGYRHGDSIPSSDQFMFSRELEQPLVHSSIVHL